MSDKFVKEEGCIYRLYKDKIGSTTKRLVVPQSKRKYILQLAHISLSSAYLECWRDYKEICIGQDWCQMSEDMYKSALNTRRETIPDTLGEYANNYQSF